MPLFAPGSSPISSSLVPDPHPLASSPDFTRCKDQWTVTLKTVRVKTVLSVGKSESHVRHQGQSWERGKSDSLHSPTVSSVIAKIQDTFQTSVLIHAPADGAGRHTTPIRSAPHPISRAPPPNVLFPSTTSTWEQYAPPRLWPATIRTSPALQQEITTVTWKVSPPTSHVEVPL